MALIVEDGSVVSNANSFVDLADGRTIAASLGVTLADDDAEAESNLSQAYLQLVRQYEPRAKGERVDQTQTGIYPRNYVVARGFSVSATAIPQDIVYAQVELAGAINGGADLHKQKEQQLKSFSVDGGLYTETYQDGSKAPTTPSFPAVTQWLNPYLNGLQLKADWGYDGIL